MSLTLHSVPGNYRASVIQSVADYLELPTTINPMQWDDLKSKENQQRNNLGQIPTLETPEGFLGQTNAILRYLANTSKKLYGENDFEKALVDQWLEFSSLEVSPITSSINYKIWGWGNPPQGQMNAATKAFDNMLEIMNTHLENKQFFVGNISIADFAIFCFLVYPFRCTVSEELRIKYQNVTQWFERISSLPQVQKYFGQNRYPKKPWF